MKRNVCWCGKPWYEPLALRAGSKLHIKLCTHVATSVIILFNPCTVISTATVTQLSLVLDIIVHPEPLNATLGSRVAFNCSAVADVVNWRINGLTYDDLENRVTFQTDVDTIPTGPNTYNSTLKLLVSTEDDATVMCVAVSFSSPSAFSREAVLLVQGTLWVVSVAGLSLCIQP